jgi:thiamine kinase-like enzyme
MASPAIIDSVLIKAHSNQRDSHGPVLHKENGNVVKCDDIYVNASANDRDAQIERVVRVLCPFLDQSKCALQISPLTGGFSNEVFVVSKGPHAVLVRIHPSGEQSIIDRDQECRVLAWLGQQGDAPGLHGIFKNGRIEEFLHGYIPLSYLDMVSYAPEVATQMANLHLKVVPPGLMSPSSIWTRIDALFDVALERSNEPAELSIMSEEWIWVQEQLTTPSTDPAVLFCRQTVFCHMDLQSLNILKNPDNEDLRFIDYEYAGMHPRAVDIANTWLEYADMDMPESELEYLDVEKQNAFLQAYLTKTQPAWCTDHEILQTIRTEIGKYTLVSHIFWAVWGRLQSNTGFDYLEYARRRMKGYYFMQRIFFNSILSPDK